jgi:hypothetical protein
VLRINRVRADTTVVPANVAYPTAHRAMSLAIPVQAIDGEVFTRRWTVDPGFSSSQFDETAVSAARRSLTRRKRTPTLAPCGVDPRPSDPCPSFRLLVVGAAIAHAVDPADRSPFAEELADCASVMESTIVTDRESGLRQHLKVGRRRFNPVARFRGASKSGRDPSDHWSP